MPTYLDYAATTPVDPRVLDAMLPYFSQAFGNPSSTHTFGQQAEAAIEQARETVADVLGCQSAEVIFTSCGSESDNLALRGAAFAERQKRQANHILIAAGEHHAIAHTAAQLGTLFGFDLEIVPLDAAGWVSPQAVAERIRPETAVVSVMYANNEIGTVNPIAEIGAVCHAAGVLFHTDAVQAAAYLPVQVNALRVDLLSLGAHKFYGPKGVGALYLRGGTPLIPMQTGGSQESGWRAGTHNVPYIVGLSEALRLASAERAERTAHVQPLRDHVIGQVLESIPGAHLTGSAIQRMPNHASFVFEGVDGNTLLRLLDVAGFACSSGSACKSGDPKPSGVLLALGITPELALGSLRVTLGTPTTPAEADAFLDALPGLVEKCRQLR
jgi:cysteine desulfurase